MLVPRRSLERAAPTKEAKKIYIYAEGAKRERQYFDYFKEMASQLDVQVYPLDPHDNNSPEGLLKIAIDDINKKDESQFSIQEGDEVWLVFDIDPDKRNTRKDQIEKVRNHCNRNKNWFFAVSNPCFEVWLFYHFEEMIEERSDLSLSSTWKDILFTYGGFDSKKHPSFIAKAITNARNIYSEVDSLPEVAKTSVFRLGEKIYAFVKDKI